MPLDTSYPMPDTTRMDHIDTPSAAELRQDRIEQEAADAARRAAMARDTQGFTLRTDTDHTDNPF